MDLELHHAPCGALQHTYRKTRAWGSHCSSLQIPGTMGIYGVSPSGTGQTLALKNISMDMSGYFVCTARNEVGEEQCNISLAVTPREWGPKGLGKYWGHLLVVHWG